MIAGLCGDRILAPFTYAWSTDGIWFAEWFEWGLLPALTMRSVIIMDNASFHNRKVHETIAEAYGHKILFLPAYLPDKSPIENFWANVKN